MEENQENDQEVEESAEPVSESAADTGAETAGSSKSSLLNFFTTRKFVYLIVIIVAASLVLWRVSTFNLPVEDPSITGQVIQTGGLVVKAGDNVEVQYKGTLEDGTEFDSGTLEFVAGSGQMIAGFDEAVVGMAVGEEKTATLPPEKAYGPVNPDQRISLPQEFSIERVLNVTTTQFVEAFSEDAEVGAIYEDDSIMMPLIVTSIVADTVFLKWETNAGDKITTSMEPWDLVVSEINDTSIALYRDVVTGTIIDTALGPKTVLVENGFVTIDMNHELAGKTLNFEIRILNIDRLSAAEQACAQSDIPKTDKPQVEVFVMSYCPYGLQMEKGVIPVQELLGDKADIEIKFVNYVMHGKKEIDENTIEYCLQKEQPEKFWSYLKCFVGSGKSDDCLAENGIENSSLDSCIAAADEEFKITEFYDDKSSWSNGIFPLYKVHDIESKLYGVGGSPTVIINGKSASISPRSPENVKNNICCAFKDMPEECSTAMSSASPSSGFGWSESLDQGTPSTCTV